MGAHGLARYGFYRPAASFAHPIYLGNAMLAVMGLIWVLGRLQHGARFPLRIRAGIGMSIGAILASLSFSAYNGMLSAVVILLVAQMEPLSSFECCDICSGIDYHRLGDDGIPAQPQHTGE